MSLLFATFSTGLILMAAAGFLLWNARTAEIVLKAFPRSQTAAYVTMGLGSIWFLYRVLQRAEADVGNIRGYLFLIFGAIAALSFVHVKDFLAVRGLSILILLYAWVLLSAAFLEEPASRLFLVSLVYVAIVVAIYLGVSPFRLRDFFNWLFATKKRQRIFSGFLVGYGLLLGYVAIGY